MTDYKVIESRIVLLHGLLKRDADCRCGNIQLNELEIEAIKILCELASNMHVHCINNGCHMQNK